MPHRQTAVRFYLTSAVEYLLAEPITRPTLRMSRLGKLRSVQRGYPVVCHPGRRVQSQGTTIPVVPRVDSRWPAVDRRLGQQGGSSRPARGFRTMLRRLIRNVGRTTNRPIYFKWQRSQSWQSSS